MNNNETNGTDKKLWLGVKPDSQLGKLLTRLAINPTVRTQEVCKHWQQRARNGGVVNLTGTRGSFLLEALAEATCEEVTKPRAGTFVIDGVRACLRTETPVVGQAVPQPVPQIIPVKSQVKVQMERDDRKFTKDDVQVVFPDAPTLPGRLENYVRPAWYTRMAAALDAGKHVSLAGPPGGGKSTAPEQYFIAKGQPFVVVNGDGGFRRRDMEGTVKIVSGTTFVNVADFAAAAVKGWGCILNEVNAADPDALMYINGMLEVPHVVNIDGRVYPVHPDFRLIVTYNPGLIGTKPLPQAFKDRFFPIKLGFPPSVFLRKVLVTKGMPEDAPYAERLLKYARDAWSLHEKGNLRYQISPRRLFDVVFLMEKADMDFEAAVKSAVIDAVDSVPDATMLATLVTTPLKEIDAVSQYA